MRLVLSQKAGLQDSAVIPLINVVFLILIFLVITGQITNTEPDGFSYPESISVLEPTDPPLQLLITSSKQLYLNGEPINMNELREIIKPRLTNIRSSEELLFLRADAQLLVNELRSLLSELKAMGLQKITIATLQRS